MASKVIIDDKQFQELLEEMEDLPGKSMQELYPFYKSKTPIRSGNARNKTKLYKRDNTIRSNYGYAGSLDDGLSRQSPEGFTSPSIEELDNIVEKRIKRL